MEVFSSEEFSLWQESSSQRKNDENECCAGKGVESSRDNFP